MSSQSDYKPQSDYQPVKDHIVNLLIALRSCLNIARNMRETSQTNALNLEDCVTQGEILLNRYGTLHSVSLLTAMTEKNSLTSGQIYIPNTLTKRQLDDLQDYADRLARQGRQHVRTSTRSTRKRVKRARTGKKSLRRSSLAKRWKHRKLP